MVFLNGQSTIKQKKICAIACDRGDRAVVVSGVNHWGLTSYLGPSEAALSLMACNQDCAWAWSRAQQDCSTPTLKKAEPAPQAALQKDHTGFRCIDGWKDPSFELVAALVENSPWEYWESYSLDFGHYSPTMITSNWTFRSIPLKNNPIASEAIEKRINAHILLLLRSRTQFEEKKSHRPL